MSPVTAENMSKQPLDPAAIRDTLAGKKGPEYWRTLEELSQTPEFQEYLYNEFPPLATQPPDALSRRGFLRVMAASLALAGATSACGFYPRETIVPYVKAPENIVPGKALYYATAVPRNGFGLGLLVESHMGRPTKVEGNPDHPASRGATDAVAQASVLTLWDPDRSSSIIHRGTPSTWGAFSAAMATEMANQQMEQGRGMRILTPTITSPTLAAQIRALLAKLPGAKWHQYDPITRDGRREGARLAFGEPVDTVYNFENADVVLALDGDVFSDDPGAVRYERDFMSRRRVTGQTPDAATMNRLYVIESGRSLVGGCADHRLPVRPSQIEPFARALAQRLGAIPGEAVLPEGIPAEWFDALVRDLENSRGRSLVVPGEQQPAAVHALAHAINAALGNAGQTVVYIDPVEAEPVNQTASLRELVEEMEAGKVNLLVILEGNPIYTSPADLDFAAPLIPDPQTGEKRVRTVVHLSLYEDETSYYSDWHVAAAHYLEAWGDVRAFDGTVSIIQPLIAPLYDGKSPLEVLAVLNGNVGATPYDQVRAYWKAQVNAPDFEKFWAQAVHDGVIPDTAHAPRTVAVQANLELPEPSPRTPNEGDLEVVFRPDPFIRDGEYANNAWLQELPKPFTHITWDNVAAVSLATAKKLDVGEPSSDGWWREAPIVTVAYGGREIQAPVWIVPGMPDDTVTLYLGYGRSRGGNVATIDRGQPRGYNAYALRISFAPWFDTGASLRKTRETYQIATTQPHHRIPPGRGMVMKSLDLAAFKEEAAHGGHEGHEMISLYPEWEYKGYAWGMAIDQTACTGCSACVVACVAENNIPVVGKDQVIMGREMHWLRIDTYYQGDAENPRANYQPMLCQHCEKAPCEPVCPVGATVHDDEGLNDMVYNRCVGTRYCSNNCPYKVRRFNFFEFNDNVSESLKAQRNPDVTVRARGVMEKCSFCVQRINLARIEAKKANRRITDGEVVTACQTACPTGAIVFGDINDSEAAVVKLKAQPHNYAVLGDLNTQPRTTYLARLWNPNPDLQPPAAATETEVDHA
jgi:MoCo/4Fe-4S cofactor protein with predicted Tat translocation signal